MKGGKWWSDGVQGKGVYEKDSNGRDMKIMERDSQGVH